MKIGWGTAIVLVLVAFMSFILFFVIRMTIDSGANHDLVTEDYYNAELGYQKEIDAENNALNDNVQLKMEQTPEGLLIEFPSRLDFTKIKGVVSLYRPSNKHLDKEIPINISTTHLLIPNKNLVEGRWDIKVFWQYDTEEYLFKKEYTH